MEQAIAPATRAAYKRGAELWFTYCLSYHRSVSWSPNVDQLLEFITIESQYVIPKRTHTAVRKMISGVRYRCLLEGGSVEAFADERLRLFMRGVRKLNKGTTRPVRLPINTRILSLLFTDKARGFVGRTPFSDVFEAAASLGVRALLRAGEFCTKGEWSCILRRSDIAWTADGGATLTLRQSKTDQFGEGVSIRLYRDPPGSAVCAVRNLQTVWNHNCVASAPEDPLFLMPNGKPLTYAAFSFELKRRLINMGFDTTRYSSHSLRAGGATDLAALGFPAMLIRHMGRWSSGCYTIYTRPSECNVEEAYRAVARTALSSSQLDAFAANNPDDLKLLSYGLPISVFEQTDLENIDDIVGSARATN